MKNPIAAGLLLALAAASAVADEADASNASATLSANTQSLCVFDKQPAAHLQYRVLRKLKVGKGSYGSVRDVLPRLGNQALMLGADALIDYNGAQRFGFLPWRFVRPVVSGTAIKWQTPTDASCESLGGTRLQTIIDSNKEPVDRPAATAPAAPASEPSPTQESRP